MANMNSPFNIRSTAVLRLRTPGQPWVAAAHHKATDSWSDICTFLFQENADAYVAYNRKNCTSHDQWEVLFIPDMEKSENEVKQEGP